MGCPMATEVIDRTISDVLRTSTSPIANTIITRHDENFPHSNLRALSYEERLRWVESCLLFIADRIDCGSFVPWSHNHLANISGNFAPDTPPYYAISNFYENTLPMEACILPFLWKAVDLKTQGDQPSLLAAVERLRYHIQAYTRANLDPVYEQVRSYEEQLVATARIQERERTSARYANEYVTRVARLREQIALLGRFVDNRAFDDAQSALALCKLQVAELLGCLPASTPTPSVAPQSTAPTPVVASTPRPAISKREHTILKRISQGMTNSEIARELDLSAGTVRNYISTLMVKLGADNRTQLAMLAMQQGLIN